MSQGTFRGKFRKGLSPLGHLPNEDEKERKGGKSCGVQPPTYVTSKVSCLRWPLAGWAAGRVAIGGMTRQVVQGHPGRWPPPRLI